MSRIQSVPRKSQRGFTLLELLVVVAILGVIVGVAVRIVNQMVRTNNNVTNTVDVVQRIAQGTVQFGMASGDSILLARAQGLPVVTVATNSQRFAAVFFSKAESNIKTPADLKGKSVGIPGHFGAS